jgi:hypothetical protein
LHRSWQKYNKNKTRKVLLLTKEITYHTFSDHDMRYRTLFVVSCSFERGILFAEKINCEYKQDKKETFPVTNYHAMKTYGEREIYLHTFYTSALDGGEWSVSRSGHVTPREAAPTHPLGCRLDEPQIGLDAAENRTPAVQTIA